MIHTIEQYNKYSFDYPYPVAISVNGPVGGMEYPMMSFNGRRPVKDDKTGALTYSQARQVWPDQRDHPRGGPQLLPDDRQFGRAPVDLDGRGAEHLPAVPGRAGVGRELSGAPRRAARHRRLHAQHEPGADHDECRVDAAARRQRLRQAGHRLQHPARDGAGPRAVRLRVQGIRRALEVQAPDSGRLLPHDGRRVGHGPRLVLARLVLHDRRGGHQRRRHQRVHGVVARTRKSKKPGSARAARPSRCR